MPIGSFHFGRNVLPNTLFENPATRLHDHRPGFGDNIPVYALDSARPRYSHGAPQSRNRVQAYQIFRRSMHTAMAWFSSGPGLDRDGVRHYDHLCVRPRTRAYHAFV